MANNEKENKIEKFTKEAIGKTLNQFNKEIGMADLVEINKNQDRILNGILSQVNDENTEKTEKSNIITLDNSTDGIVELKEIQGDTNVNVSKIEEETPITHVIEDKEGNTISLDNITEGAINIDNIQGNTMVNCNKEPDKEIILNGNINTEGYSNVTLTEGVDGGLVDVALEGNTMVNVCDQKDPVAITKSYTVETGNHAALQGEYDGKCRPVVTGNTLVNIIDSFGSVINAEADFSTGSYKCTANGTARHLYYKVIPKISTTYTAIAYVNKNTINNKFSLIGLDVTENNSPITIPTGFTGLFVSKFTTKADNLDNIWETDLWKENTEGEIEIKGFMILEGDYTNKPIPEYFTGLQSSFEDKVVTQEMVDAGEELAENLGRYKVDYVVTGKNKFDGKRYLTMPSDLYNSNSQYITINEDGSINRNTAEDYRTSKDMEKYKLIPNTTYTISTNPIVPIQIHLKSGKIYQGNTPATFTTSNDDNIGIKFIGGENSSPVKNIYVQIEEGSTATPYEPYKEYKKTFYLNSPLLEGDTIEQQGDNVVHVHRYGKVVLDGSEDENWFTQSLSDSDTTLGFRNQTNINSKEKANALSDRFVNMYSWAKVEHMHFNRNTLNITISKSKLQTQDIAGLRQWLQANPTTVVYELETPQYEVISQNNTILCDSYVNGHLDIDSVVPIKKIQFQLNGAFSPTYLYPSTEYVIQFESDNIGFVNNLILGGNGLIGVNITKGLNKFKTTTPDTISNSILAIYGIGFNASNIVVTEATDQDFGYFEGMKSVGECEDLAVVSSNKNLFDLYNNYILSGEANIHDISINNDELTVESKYTCSVQYWFKVEKGQSYTLSFSVVGGSCDSGGICRIGRYNPNDINNILIAPYYIQEYCHIGDSKTYTFTPKDNFIIVALMPNSSATFSNIIFKGLMLTKTNSSTDYTPHQSNAQTLTHEPLRAVGDIKDKYVLIDGKWYIERNCAEVVLDGSADETWTAGMSNAYYSFDDLSRESDYTDNIICNYLKTSRYHSSDIMEVNSITGYYDLNKYPGKNWIYLKLNDSINDYKAWLQSNPLTVIYKKAQPTYEPIDYNPFTVYSDITHISNNSTIPCNMTIKNTGYNCLLKPSTTYTVSSNLGLNTVTTPSVLSEDCLRFYDTDTSSVTKMKDVTILEGDYTTGKPLPAHFSGIESAFEQEYDEEKGKYKVRAKVVGKNLFDVQLANFNNYTLPGGAYKSCKIRLVQGNNYTLSITGSGSTGEYYLLSTHANPNEKGAYWYPIIADGVSPINQTITAQKQDYYVCYWNANGVTQSNFNSLMSKIKVQIEQGSTTTPYEPYKENYIEFYIDEPLRGIGDVKDRVYVKDNKVVVQRNCKKVVLDGSNDENYTLNKTFTNDLYTTYNMQLPNAYLKGVTLNDFNNNSKAIWGQQEGLGIPYLNYLYISIRNIKLQTKDIAGFKQWLQQNPITIIYQLAEPVYEEADYQEQRLFLDTYNNSTLFYESNIPVSNTSFKPLWEKLAYLKNSTKYYIQFNSTASGTVVFNLGGTEVTKDIVEGYNNIAITTPAETTNLLTIDGHGINISEVVISESVCGGHYLGLQSCFEEHMENGKYRILLRGIALDGNKVNGIKLYINEPLRGIKDARDRLCIKDGKLMVERKCGEAIFDGSNYIQSMDTSIDTKKRWLIYQDSSIKDVSDSQVTTINDKYCDISANDTWYNKEGISQNSMQHAIHIYLERYSDGSDESKQALISELQQNPTTVVYQLATPTYEEATNEYGLPIVFEGYENGIVYIDSAVTPTTHIKYTSNNQLATTLSEAEEQNNSTQDDINVNVVTYMMDIDMLLTEMEMSNDISVMAVRRDSSNENMLDRMSDEDKKVYRDNTVVMLEKMITAKVLDKEDIEERIDMYYDKNRISKEQYKYLKSLL